MASWGSTAISRISVVFVGSFADRSSTCQVVPPFVLRASFGRNVEPLVIAM